MATLEDLTPGARIQGVLPDRPVNVVQVEWHGTTAVTLTYKDDQGRVAPQLLYRDDEARLAVEEAGAAFAFDGDGGLFRLASEATRIRLAYLFDPVLAVHTSSIDPLPHQISAVYQELLTRQPLRYLLADDPGAGKTIMAGLFIKELMVRGDVRRCLIVTPGSLVEQWQDELWQKFRLDFDIVTRETVESSKSGNPFAEKNLVIGLAASTYYAAATRPPSPRAQHDAHLKEAIEFVWDDNYGVYGADKVWAQLHRHGVPVARCTVERLMRELEIAGVVRGKKAKTTITDDAAACPADLVDRQFVADAPNRLWVADLTYVKTHSGWVYVAFIVDVFSRRVVGWQASRSLRTDLALDALEMAMWARRGEHLDGLIHHSDRGGVSGDPVYGAACRSGSRSFRRFARRQL